MFTGVPPSLFYKSTRERKCSSKDIPIDVFVPRRFLSIFGPSTTWKIFSKQSEALTFVKNYGECLMTFAFQRNDGTRGFLAADPAVFWWYDSRKRPSDRRTFEIIAENEKCKLYLDLEFDRSCNPDSDGVRMTNTFIDILCFVLRREFGIECDRRAVLDLDSTTDSKFSRHLIFQLKDACFRNNYHVGSFVKMICQEIRVRHTSATGLWDLPAGTINELFVKDKKNQVNLFCDLGVYTKNRHFRLYQSTKWNKNAPLVVSAQNMYEIQQNSSRTESPDEQLFLDSLVTYTTHSQVTVLNVPVTTCDSHSCGKETGKMLLSTPIQSDMALGNSPIPVVDKFIQSLVHPGHIRRWFYFLDSNTLDYDIIGNRYCHNIGRAHKSNNVKYVVDLKKGVYYQKCYDSDCAGYRSPETQLPTKVLLLLENDFEFGKMTELSDEEWKEVWESVEAVLEEESLDSGVALNKTRNEDFPEYGLSDADLLNLSTSVK